LTGREGELRRAVSAVAGSYRCAKGKGKETEVIKKCLQTTPGEAVLRSGEKKGMRVKKRGERGKKEGIIQKRRKGGVAN